MQTHFRITALAMALCGSAALSADAQQLATFGSAELAGLGEGSALLGTSLSTGRMGVSPIAGITAQTYTYRSGPSTSTNTAVAPSVGLQYRGVDHAIQGSVGYNFVNGNSSTNGFPFGIASGGENSVFVNAQANFWGNGMEDGAIASYNIKSRYVWSRLRLAREIVTTPTPTYLGGEFVAQGSSKFSPSAYRFQAGPTINFHLSPTFHLGGSAGARFGNQSQATTGYVGANFLLLTDFAK